MVFVNFAEKNQDVLQNIEFEIVSYYRMNSEITDYTVMRPLEKLIDLYVAQKIGRSPKNFSLNEKELELAERVQIVCDWRLGTLTKQDMPEIEPISLDDMIACLKLIQKSLEKCTKQNGRQGYLQFISRFIP